MTTIAEPVAYDVWYHTPRSAWIGGTEFSLLMSLLRPEAGTRWDTAGDVRSRITGLKPEPRISTRYGIFLPGGSRVSRVTEYLLLSLARGSGMAALDLWSGMGHAVPVRPADLTARPAQSRRISWYSRKRTASRRLRTTRGLGVRGRLCLYLLVTSANRHNERQDTDNEWL
jgi:hypothetical protein